MNKYTILFALPLFLTLTACDKDDPHNPNPKKVLDFFEYTT